MKKIVTILLLAALKLHAQTNIVLTTDITYDWVYESSGRMVIGQWPQGDAIIVSDIHSNNIARVSINGVTNRMVLSSYKIGQATIVYRYKQVPINTNIISCFPLKTQ